MYVWLYVLIKIGIPQGKKLFGIQIGEIYVDSLVLDHPVKPWNQDSFNGLWLLGCAFQVPIAWEPYTTIYIYTVCKYI